MSVFDPYSQKQQPAMPGLNTGSQTQVSTMVPVDIDGIRTNRYRSGALSALAPFLGYCSVVLAAAMGLAGLAGRALCLEGRLDAAVCEAEPSQLVLLPAAVLFFGLVFATIGGSLAKKRRASGSLVALVLGVAALVLATQWFSTTLLGLPFP
ncbi:hypothetical protein [Pseudactinotalea suaedae]|uniref:hypothetical protein n=1 Tax=Pseudactinotalea suaedae TaxID=1524924 RepID=UPI0012E0F41E|nr:hypothetical protein [Pseudactinotalea suaedae]